MKSVELMGNVDPVLKPSDTINVPVVKLPLGNGLANPGRSVFSHHVVNLYFPGRLEGFMEIF